MRELLLALPLALIPLGAAAEGAFDKVRDIEASILQRELEVKISSSLDAKDFKSLELCRRTIGDKFKKGIVLYTGNDLVPMGDRLWAVPVNYLWE